MRFRDKIRLLLTLVLPLLVLSGCAGIRMVTYPKEFTWLGDDQVTGVMQSMARSMFALDQLISGTGTDTIEQQKVLDELEKIEYQALSLQPATAGSEDTDRALPATNHLLIDENLDQFIETLTRAKLQIQAIPPNYYIVGQLTGGCNSCHRNR